MGNNILKNPEQIETVRGLMQGIQQELEQVKNGEMSPELARLVLQIRKQQINVAQLQLQYARLNRNKLKSGAKDRNLITGEDVVIDVQPEGDAKT